MGNVNKAIDRSKYLIEEVLYRMPRLQNKFLEVGFKDYCLFYYQTNENLEFSLSNMNVQGKNSALCVAGSGDQAFSLVQKGIKNITMFDINNLAEYVSLGLKLAMISKYNFQEFKACNELFTNIMSKYDEVLARINDLLSYMPLKYRKYWSALIDFTYKLCKENHTDFNLIYLLAIERVEKSSVVPYIQNEIIYNDLKYKLKHANITYQYADGAELTHYFKKPFDIIYLSNIIDYFGFSWFKYWHQGKLEQYIDDLNKLLNSKGEAMVYYSFLPIEKEQIRWSLAHISEIEDLEKVEFQGRDTIYLTRKK